MATKKVLEVTKVTLTINGDLMTIQAEGNVSSGGWTCPRLIPTGNPPSSGVYAFDFVAEEPQGAATTAITKILVEYGWYFPKNAEGVRVNAQQNSIEKNY